MLINTHAKRSLTSRTQARGTNQREPRSGTESAIPRCQQFVRPTNHTHLGETDLPLCQVTIPVMTHQANDTTKPISPTNNNTIKNPLSKFCHMGISSWPFGGTTRRAPINPSAAEIPLNANPKTGRLIFMHPRRPNDRELSQRRRKLARTNRQPSDYPARPTLKGQRRLAPVI